MPPTNYWRGAWFWSSTSQQTCRKTLKERRTGRGIMPPRRACGSIRIFLSCYCTLSNCNRDVGITDAELILADSIRTNICGWIYDAAADWGRFTQQSALAVHGLCVERFGVMLARMLYVWAEMTIACTDFGKVWLEDDVQVMIAISFVFIGYVEVAPIRRQLVIYCD